MGLFPEVFSNHSDKFNRAAVWLVNKYSIVCPNIRDVFTAGGRGEISWEGRTYHGIPKVIIKMIDSINDIFEIINSSENETLEKYWNIECDHKITDWLDLAVEYSKFMNLPFNLKDYLISIADSKFINEK